MKDRKLLEEICDGCDVGYCTLKEILMSSGLSDRQALQIKMIEKFKYVWSEHRDQPYDFNEAGLRFVQDGYATEFARLYEDNDNIHVLSMWSKLQKYVPLE